MKFKDIERIDKLTEDGDKQLLFWINLTDPEPEIEELAKEIELDHLNNYDGNGFSLAINYDLRECDFVITVPFYYMDSDGNVNDIDYEVDESLLKEIMLGCLNELKGINLVKYKIKKLLLTCLLRCLF